jgi:hypothetical protein
LGQALREKPRGNELGAASYSRITGLFGAVVTTSLFWAVGNIVIWRLFEDPDAARKVIEGTVRLFLVGSALFLPYAFNQLRAMVNPIEATVARPDAIQQKASTPDTTLAPGVVVPQPNRIAMPTALLISNSGGANVAKKVVG